MCLTLPARVEAVEGAMARVARDGRSFRATTLLLPDVHPGEWVIVASGTIVERLTDAEAGELRAALREVLGP